MNREVFSQTHVGCNGTRTTRMTKRLQIIVTTIAIIFFILAFYLDITSFGQHRYIFWTNIELIRILLIVAITIVFGVLLGLFLFQKQNYKYRISLTIPIA